MDGRRFDDLTRSLAKGASRRSLVKGLIGGLGGLAAIRRGAAAQDPPGTACDSARDCASFRCVDGYCCDTSCTGQCEACDVAGAEGTCTPVSGPPHGSRGACAGADVCAATCDGLTTTHCAGFPGPDVVCADPVCEDVWLTTYACGGNGACVPTTTSCAPFGCADGTACATGCQTDAECADGTACVNGQCVAGKPIGESCVEGGECQSGICAQGYCCAEACTGACRACNLPGNEGFCTEIGDGEPCASGTCCDGECVDTNTTIEHCGFCDNTCLSVDCLAPVCAGGVCGTVPDAAQDGTPCDDGDPCTTNDVCTEGVCAGVPLCTRCQFCDGGACFPDPNQIGDDCNDGNACTENDVCGASGQCVGTPVVCDEKRVCQDGVCVCPPDKPVDCGFACVNECCDDSACPSGETCCFGVCVPPSSCPFTQPRSAERMWQALTDSRAIAAWGAENDFAPVVGHRFRVGSTQGTGRDAAMEGEVVAVEPYRLLAFTWRGGTMKRPLTVTFTLEPDGDGVRLNLTRSHEDRAACAATRRLFGRNWAKTVLGEALPRYLEGDLPD